MFFQAREQLAIACVRSRRLIDHDNVETGHQVVLLAERLAGDPLDPVSRNRATAMFTRYGETESALLAIVAPAHYGKKLVAATAGGVENAAIRCRVEEPIVFAKPVARAACQS